MIKKMMMGAMVFVFCISLFGEYEEETLFQGEIVHGGFGGPVVKFTQVKDEFGVLVGGRGGWIINHTLSLGGGGYGLANQIAGPEGLPYVEPILSLGYGGFEMEYICRSGRLLHSTVSLLIGAGGVGYVEGDKGCCLDREDKENLDSFFIVEPSFQVELNVSSFLRMDLGIGYRFVSGVETEDLSNSDIGGPSLNLIFKFGRF